MHRTRQSKKERLAELERICRDRGMARTPQRRLIFAAMLDLDEHPTADGVFQYMRGQGLDVSRATVHRTLDFLVDLGLITKACNPGNIARYDARTEIHHHLVCLGCSAMLDIQVDSLDAIPFPDTGKTGFAVKDFRVQFRGLCRECRQDEAKKVQQPQSGEVKR